MNTSTKIINVSIGVIFIIVIFIAPIAMVWQDATSQKAQQTFNSDSQRFQYIKTIQIKTPNGFLIPGEIYEDTETGAQYMGTHIGNFGTTFTKL